MKLARLLAEVEGRWSAAGLAVNRPSCSFSGCFPVMGKAATGIQGAKTDF